MNRLMCVYIYIYIYIYWDCVEGDVLYGLRGQAHPAGAVREGCDNNSNDNDNNDHNNNNDNDSKSYNNGIYVINADNNTNDKKY